MTWTHTSRGRALDLLDPQYGDVDLEEIARALGHQCRYNGCTTRFYSVAEHCVLVSEALERDGHPPLVQLAGLLHDAAEAYTGDITWPVQQVVLADAGARSAYRAMQRRLDELIAQHAHVADWADLADAMRRDPVREYDLRILLDERDVVLTGRPRPWFLDEAGAERLGMIVTGLDPAGASAVWLSRLRVLQTLVTP